jgi:hypothetical protein
MPPLDGLLETALYVDDPARSSRFYRDVFGFEEMVANTGCTRSSSRTASFCSCSARVHRPNCRCRTTAPASLTSRSPFRRRRSPSGKPGSPGTAWPSCRRGSGRAAVPASTSATPTATCSKSPPPASGRACIELAIDGRIPRGLDFGHDAPAYLRPTRSGRVRRLGRNTVPPLRARGRGLHPGSAGSRAGRRCRSLVRRRAMPTLLAALHEPPAGRGEHRRVLSHRLQAPSPPAQDGRRPAQFLVGPPLRPLGRTTRGTAMGWPARPTTRFRLRWRVVPETHGRPRLAGDRPRRVRRRRPRSAGIARRSP